jgi:heterotetrameric sarcosine oxidase gamma subunit
MRLDTKPKRLSPLHNRHETLGARFELRGGWLIPEVYTNTEDEGRVLQESVGLADISTRGKLTLKGVTAGAIISASFGESPTKAGAVIEIRPKHILVAQLTPDEFLVLTFPDSEKEIRTSLEAETASQNTFVSLIDQTSGLVGFSIVGLESINVMRKLCALSFNPKDFPDLHVAQSSFAKVRTTILRHGQSASPAFELLADRSYADYLWDAILDAGMEFGIQPVGWEAISSNI